MSKRFSPKDDNNLQISELRNRGHKHDAYCSCPLVPGKGYGYVDWHADANWPTLWYEMLADREWDAYARTVYHWHNLGKNVKDWPAAVCLAWLEMKEGK